MVWSQSLIAGFSVHLIHDLQPYHCTFERCHDSNRIYGTRQEWLEHESLHTRVWHCTVHGEEFETQPEYIAHLHEEHPEHKAEYFSPELIAAVVGPSLRPRRDCPFCPAAFSEASALKEHVTFHLERLALLALPADGEDEIDKPERASESHEGQRRGRPESIEADFALPADDEDEIDKPKRASDSHEGQHRRQLESIEAESMVEESLVLSDSELTTSNQPGPSMAAIQEAVSRREEETFLLRRLEDSGGADADPSQGVGWPRPRSRHPATKGTLVYIWTCVSSSLHTPFLPGQAC